jgi:hypothetical protein
MRRPIWRSICAALALSLAGCAGTVSHPGGVGGVGESGDYPLEAAGFRKLGVYSLSLQTSSASVQYRLCSTGSPYDPFVEILATIRITRVTVAAHSARAALDEAKVAIEQSRFGGELLDEGAFILTKNGERYVALKAAYSTARYSQCLVGVVLGFPQPRYVELIVWRHEDRIMTLQSNARLENRNAASAKNLELLDAVNWTILPL